MLVDYDIPSLEHTIDGRSSMRSIADALEALRAAQLFHERYLAQIRTKFIQLPTGEVTSIVLVIGPQQGNDPSHGVALPSSAYFKGKGDAGDWEEFQISRLDRAWVDNNGRVELSDGTCFHAVNVIPTVMRPELTEVQKRIVYWTINFIGAEAKCYRYGPPAPDLEWLDYATLSRLEVPKLEAIAHYIIVEKNPGLCASRQTIANALRASGMRRPRSGPLAA